MVYAAGIELAGLFIKMSEMLELAKHVENTAKCGFMTRIRFFAKHMLHQIMVININVSFITMIIHS